MACESQCGACQSTPLAPQALAEAESRVRSSRNSEFSRMASEVRPQDHASMGTSHQLPVFGLPGIEAPLEGSDTLVAQRTVDDS